jgi:hypothetical protein
MTTHDYDQAQSLTAMSLKNLMNTTDQLTQLELPERTALVDEISRVVPAGNVPGLLTAGLASLPGRAVPVSESRRNLSLLIQGMQTFMDEATFRAFFVGPAVVLSAYQMMLKLAGKDVEASFPEGTWQFYVEFGLREDSGRHASETVGFEQALKAKGVKLSNSDELATWVMASIWLLDHYPDLLANEWYEKVRLRHLSNLLNMPNLFAQWTKIRPYGVPEGVTLDFTAYRRNAFELFCKETLEKANPRQASRAEDAWNAKTAAAEREARLSAWQRQMMIHATLTATEHNDERTPIQPHELCIGVISGGRYYLINLESARGRVRAICDQILKNKASTTPTDLDKLLVSAHRHDQVALRRMLPREAQADLDALRHAPILINWDLPRSETLLTDIRGGRRGIGDHAMTIFRAAQTMVFDQSHIFFDGTWGIAIAEILTNQATRLAFNLPSDTGTGYPSSALEMPMRSEIATSARRAAMPPEVSAESTLAKLEPILELRRKLQARNAELQLTVNDILILYRSLFGQIYQPSAELMRAVSNLQNDPKTRNVAELVQAGLQAARQPNPALLIPMDATKSDPRERIYPTTIRNPFSNLLEQHRKALTRLEAVETASILTRIPAVQTFEGARRDYFGTINAFGQVMTRYKDVSMRGESVSTQTIRLLAGLPGIVQRMLDSLPNRLDIINDVVKGQEVFSNVGQVSETSSLTRFNTARDDNEKKWLAWGIMTDAQGMIHISLRDFRPHVAALVSVKQGELAQKITQEYVDAYALSLNTFIEEMLKIARWRRGDTHV